MRQNHVKMAVMEEKMPVSGVILISGIPGLQNLPSIIFARDRVDVMWPVHFTRLLVLDIGRGLQCIGRTTKPALHAGDLAFWNSHPSNNSLCPQPNAPPNLLRPQAFCRKRRPTGNANGQFNHFIALLIAANGWNGQNCFSQGACFFGLPCFPAPPIHAIAGPQGNRKNRI